MYGYNETKVKAGDAVRRAFDATAQSLHGLERMEARRVLRALWIAFGLDEVDPVASPEPVIPGPPPGPYPSEGQGEP